MPVVYVLLEDVDYEGSDQFVAVFQEYPTVKQLAEQLNNLGYSSGFIATQVDKLHKNGRINAAGGDIHIKIVTPQ